MEKTADIEPLEDRREYKALAQAEKAKRLPSHPLHNKLKKRKGASRLKRQSLNKIVQNLQEAKSHAIEPEAESLKPTKWTRRQFVPQIRCDVPGIKGKGKQTPILQKSLTQEMIQQRYPPHSCGTARRCR